MTIKTLLIEYDDTHGNVMGEFTLRAPAVDVVLCKDCKFRADRGDRHYCDACAGGFPEIALDDFCAWGERRDE